MPQTKVNMSNEKFKFIINRKNELAHIPIVENADFGHTNPMVTLPIGGLCELDAINNEVNLVLSEP